MQVLFCHRAKGKFDQLSGSKVLEVITSRVDESGVRHLLRLYQQMLETGAADSVVTGYVVTDMTFALLCVHFDLYPLTVCPLLPIHVFP